MDKYILVAANSIAELRKVDVFRVLESNRADIRLSLARFIADKRPDLLAEVDDVMREEFQIAEWATDKSMGDMKMKESEQANSTDIFQPITTWNTGRGYGSAGQRMAAVMLPSSGRVAFADADRGIDGITVRSMGQPAYSVNDLQKHVMDDYDAGQYVEGFYDVPDIGNGIEATGFAVKLHSIAKEQITKETMRLNVSKPSELMEVCADVLKGREPEVHSKDWFDACFKGDTPPQDLRDFSESFVKKYGIKGICDPMYIVNVTAFELGCGDGRGEFTEGRECLPEKFDCVAEEFLFSYGSGVQNTSLLMTKEDVAGLLASAIEAGRKTQEFVSTGIHCGAITKNEGGVVTQKTGRAPGDVVQHDCARLIVGKDPAVMLAVGKVVDIRYSDGVGVVMPQLEIDR